MAANPLIFKNSEKVRDSITESQKKEIANLYNDWANEIGKMAEYYARKETSSAPVSERYYRELQKQLRTTSQEVSNEVYKKIRGNMYTVSDAVVADNVNWLKQFGFSEDGLNAAFSYVPDSIVRSIVTGQVYESGWSLSERIWGNNEQTMKDLYRIVAGGVAQQMPIKDISKQLEQYVRPGAAKQWNLVDKDGRKIYPRQVDYNAQRLARTLVQHSYQQSFDAVNRNNPFVTDYVWNANGSRVCELCLSRDGQHFKKDELPLDHPNGMCTMEPNVDPNMEDKLVEWFNSEDGTFPEIDEFAKNFGYDVSQWQQNKIDISEMKLNTKVSSLEKEQFYEWYKQFTGSTNARFNEAWQEYSDKTMEELFVDLIRGRTECKQRELLDKLHKNMGSIPMVQQNKEKQITFSLQPTPGRNIPVSVYEEAKIGLEKQTGKIYSDERVLKMVDAINEYTGTDYLDILAANSSKGSIYDDYRSMMDKSDLEIAKQRGKDIEEFLENSPKYSGKAYRALGFDIGGDYGDESWYKFKEQMAVGNVMEMESFSSWTTEKRIVSQLLDARVGIDETAEESISVVLVLDESKTGVDIDKYSTMNQSEILFGRNAKFKVESINEEKENYYVIKVKEML